VICVVETTGPDHVRACTRPCAGPASLSSPRTAGASAAVPDACAETSSAGAADRSDQDRRQRSAYARAPARRVLRRRSPRPAPLDANDG